MKLLIVGASGLIGWNLHRTAAAKGHEVLGTYSSHPLPGLQQLNLDDLVQLEKLVAQFRPEVVVCCAAWSWVDGCEQDPARAFRENAEMPARLATLASLVQAQFLHFSSSYVFDGREGPYNEEAPPHPLSIYGQSKLKGEQRVQEATSGKGLIARTMGVYGEEPQRKNFVYQVVDKLRAGTTMSVPFDQAGNASHAVDVAEMVLLLLKIRASGVWNVAGPDPHLSRKDFALRIAQEYGLDPQWFRFVPTSELAQSAPRPLQGGLFVDRVVNATGYRPTIWRPISGPTVQRLDQACDLRQ